MKNNIQKEIEDNILPNLTRETCLILNNNQKKLEQLTWSEGENNKDVPFSELAKECCSEAFLKINKVKNLRLSIDIPDLKSNFPPLLLQNIVQTFGSNLLLAEPGIIPLSVDFNSIFFFYSYYFKMYFFF